MLGIRGTLHLNKTLELPPKSPCLLANSLPYLLQSQIFLYWASLTDYTSVPKSILIPVLCAH